MYKEYSIFDSHFHIIDPRFPLVRNKCYLPFPFTCEDYLQRLKTIKLLGGAVVSGSFQAFDQTYLLDALKKLGPDFVGVTQLPSTTHDNEVIKLHEAGVRALRFNIKRYGAEQLQELDKFARRVYEIAGWHIELYIDSKHLPDLYKKLKSLPAVSIDHLGLSKAGFNTLVKLADQGVRVKASGFSRVDVDVPNALKKLYSINPKCLMFGTDLPSTRAPKVYTNDDLQLVAELFEIDELQKILSKNAIEFYKIKDL